MKTIRLIILAVIFATPVAGSVILAQTWRLHLNVNEYYPIYADEKGYYPVLWYSGDDDRGLLFGGFGGGVSWHKSWGPRWGLKAQANLFRSRYYDEPVILLDENGAPIGAILGVTTNLNTNLLCIPTFSVAPWLQVGAGLGVQGLLLSKSDYGKAAVQGRPRDLKFTNRSVQPVIMTLPVECAFMHDRFSLSFRFEFSLTKVSRLPYAVNERFMTGFVEFGYRLGKGKE
jgi:hypothetical protein